MCQLWLIVGFGLLVGRPFAIRNDDEAVLLFLEGVVLELRDKELVIRYRTSDLVIVIQSR